MNTARGIVGALSFSVCLSTARAADLPLNPDVTQTTIATTICQTGWTRTVRPYKERLQSVPLNRLFAGP